MGVHQGLEGGAEASADNGLGDISLENGVVDVAVVAVGSAVENQHVHDPRVTFPCSVA